MPAVLGFATIAVFLLLTMTKRVSVLVALILLPVLAALIGDFAGDLGELILGGLSKVAPTGIMIAFVVLYFSLMVDAGLFDPLSRGLLRVARGDPLRPRHRLRTAAGLPEPRDEPLVLSGVVCLGAGVMNMVPWGGPTVRAMAVLKLDSSEVFKPVLPPQGPATDVREGEDERDDREPAASTTVTAATEPESSRPATPATADGERQALRAPGDGPGTVRVPPLPWAWLLVGMRGVSLGEHQRFIFRWAFATTLVMTADALLTGAFPL